MIYQILKKAKKRVFLGGNIKGVSTLALLGKVKKGDTVVMELDSWQLQGFGDSKISPHIAVFTNLLPDHMNYYKGSMAKYFKDKANIYKYQKKGDYLIAGKEIAKKIKRKSIVPKSLPKNWRLKIAGEHNRKNAALARDATSMAGVSQRIIKKTMENFKGVEGRLELIKTIRGIKIYNDTTATTPDATVAALRAVGNNQNTVLIVGGADKGLDMKALLKEIPKFTKSVILLDGTGTKKLRNLKFEYKKANIVVFGISYDSPESLKSFKKKHVIPFTFLSDKEKNVSKAYGTKGRLWPSRATFVIGPDGLIEKIYKKINVNTHAGEILDDILAKK